jgi:hypothetical protein
LAIARDPGPGQVVYPGFSVVVETHVDESSEVYGGDPWGELCPVRFEPRYRTRRCPFATIHAMERL